MITARKIIRNYRMGERTVPALRGASINVKKGEFVAIMGPSGSGKSTLLHQLGLIDTPDMGKVKIDNVDVLKLNHQEKTKFRLKNIGIVFQFYSLLPELNALENIALPGLLTGMKRKEAFDKGMELLKTLGLSERAQHKTTQLSGGEQQRVAIARALMNNPKVLLADEPTANLDYNAGMTVVKTFRELNKKFKQTIVMVTHEKPYGKMADRIIMLKDGKVDLKI